MPRGRPRNSKFFSDCVTNAEEITSREEAALGPVLDKASPKRQFSSRKSRGRPRQPRPDVLIPEENADLKRIDNQESVERLEVNHSGELAQKKSKGRRKGEKSNVVCEFCGKIFKFRATLKQHEQIHYGIKEYECEVCNRRFLHKGTLKVHLRMHTGEKPYKCPHCPKQFRGQTALDCHIFRHTKQGTKCPQCPSIFATPSIVKQHIREVHTTERVNTCQICGVTYKHLKSLRLHLRNHQKRVCPDCGKIFHSVYAMMTHRKIHAQDHFQFKCSFCDRKFEKEDELVAHGKLRGRTYQCDMCCHSFNKADYLENHNRRNHWKEMGLDQLKIAPPKNGWNRKGVPKPKKKGTEESFDVDLPVMEPVEVAYHVDVPAVSETLINWVDDPQGPYSYSIYSVPQDVPLTVEPFCQPAEASSILEIEPDEFEKTPHLERLEQGHDELRLECDHDYAGDDFNCGNDYSTEDAPSEGNVVDEPKTEMKDEPEVAGDENLVMCAVPSEDPACKDGTVPKIEKTNQEEQIDASVEIKDADSCTDEDDTKPLSIWISKRSPKNRKISFSPQNEQLNNQTTVFEQTPLLIKDEPHVDEQIVDLPTCLPNTKKNPAVETSDGKTSQKCKRRRKSEVFKDDLSKRKEMLCPFCGDSFKGRLQLSNHKKTVHPELKPHKGPFICEICGKSYANITSLVCHRNRHQEYQRYQCDECPKAFAFRCYLETHKRAEHLHERLICSLCGKQFKYSQDLKVHMRQHEDDRPFKCDQCPSVFRYPSALRSHKAWHEQTLFTCDICSKTFKYANSLRVHKRLHSGIKRFRCEICDREFNTKAPLVRHLATHSIEREMKCIVCDRIFYKKVDLVIHQSKEHPNDPVIGKTIKIHKCEVCGQEFAKKSNMKAHSYIHGDVYKFKCKLCEGQQFKQHAGLRHHLIHFHKMDLSKKKSEEGNEKEKAQEKEDQQSSMVDATLTPAVSIVHNGMKFMVQQIQCE